LDDEELSKDEAVQEPSKMDIERSQLSRKRNTIVDKGSEVSEIDKHIYRERERERVREEYRGVYVPRLYFLIWVFEHS